MPSFATLSSSEKLLIYLILERDVAMHFQLDNLLFELDLVIIVSIFFIRSIESRFAINIKYD